MNDTRAIRGVWLQYPAIYVPAFLLCWASLALLISNGAKYVSILSWNLFGLEELYHHYTRTPGRALTGPAALIPAAVMAIVFSFTAWLIRSPKLRLVGMIFGVALAIATLLWVPNPWENM